MGANGGDVAAGIAMFGLITALFVSASLILHDQTTELMRETIVIFGFCQFFVGGMGLWLYQEY